MGIFRRGRWWHLRKRVPRRFEHLDARRPVVFALKTDSEIEARARAADVERALVAYWRALEAGQSGGAATVHAATVHTAADHAAAVELARRRGVLYRPAEELVARIERLLQSGEILSAPVVAAELGGAPAPSFTLSPQWPHLRLTRATGRRAKMRTKSEMGRAPADSGREPDRAGWRQAARRDHARRCAGAAHVVA